MEIRENNIPSVIDFPNIVFNEARTITPEGNKSALIDTAESIASDAVEELKKILGEEEGMKYYDAFANRVLAINPKEETKTITVCEDGKIKNKTINVSPCLSSYTASQLMAAEFPPLKTIVEGILKVGVCVLSAKSKIGKSWMSLQLVIAVTKGQQFLGKKTMKCDALYIDLENDKRLSRERLEILLNGEEAPNNLYIMNEVPTMDEGFSSALESFLDQHKGIHLVVIDIYAKIKYAKKSNQSDYDIDYKSISELKKVAEKYELSIILVAHNRKMVDTSDPFSNIMGSTAMQGASDQSIVISKENRNDKEATMTITGRTVEGDELKIEFDKNTCKWKLLGTAEEYEDKKKEEAYRNDPIVKTIKKTIRANGGKCSGRASDFIQDSKRFGCTIYGSPQTFNKKLEKLIPNLEYYDCIVYTATTKGQASIIHNFEQMIPFEE